MQTCSLLFNRFILNLCSLFILVSEYFVNQLVEDLRAHDKRFESGLLLLARHRCKAACAWHLSRRQASLHRLKLRGLPAGLALLIIETAHNFNHINICLLLLTRKHKLDSEFLLPDDTRFQDVNPEELIAEIVDNRQADSPGLADHLGCSLWNVIQLHCTHFLNLGEVVGQWVVGVDSQLGLQRLYELTVFRSGHVDVTNVIEDCT